MEQTAKCPECGYNVPRSRNKCPECGCPIEHSANEEVPAPDSVEEFVGNTHINVCYPINVSSQEQISYQMGQIGQYIYETFMIACDTIRSKFFSFGGRASRREFWALAILWPMFYMGFFICLSPFIFVSLLWSNMIAILVSILMQAIAFLCVFIPLVGVTLRRLHDGGHSGWWILVPPFALFYMFQPSERA